MKRLFLTVVLAAAGWCAYAQYYMIVASEKIFKSIDAYNTAIKDLDKMAEDYQKQVDDKFAEIETLYNNYQQQKASLSATTRQVLEDTILSKEKDATALQESLFGKDGTLMKKRLELIQPIQITVHILPVNGYNACRKLRLLHPSLNLKGEYAALCKCGNGINRTQILRA